MGDMNKNNSLSAMIKSNSLIVVFLGLCIAISIMTPNFLLPQNLVNVMIQISINALLATGMTFVIISGGIDVSVGSVAALAGIVATAIIKMMPEAGVFTSISISLVVSIVVGVVVGGINGLAITKFNITPFIATMGMLSIARGFAFVYTQSKPIFDLPASFGWIGQGYIADIVPVIVLLMVAIMYLAHVVLDKTSFGRYIFAVGSSEDVAKLSGINVNQVKMSVYIISGILSALGGVCLASRLATGQPAAASGYELAAIAAVVMGGTSMNGGKGKIINTVIGLLTIGIINNGLSLMQVSSYWQTITMGVIILLAVGFDHINTAKK